MKQQWEQEKKLIQSIKDKKDQFEKLRFQEEEQPAETDRVESDRPIGLELHALQITFLRDWEQTSPKNCGTSRRCQRRLRPALGRTFRSEQPPERHVP